MEKAVLVVLKNKIIEEIAMKNKEFEVWLRKKYPKIKLKGFYERWRYFRKYLEEKYHCKIDVLPEYKPEHCKKE